MLLCSIRQWLWRCAFGGRPDRLSWWQHASMWLAAFAVVSVPAVWLPVMRQDDVVESWSTTTGSCPSVESKIAYSMPPPVTYALPDECICGASSLDDEAQVEGDVTPGVARGRSALDSDVSVCAWFRYWGTENAS